MTEQDKQDFLNQAAHRYVDAVRADRKAESDMKNKTKHELKTARAILCRAVDCHKQSKVQP